MKDFNLKNCTADEITEIYNELGYSNDKREIAIMFFVDKMSNKEVWKELCRTQRNVEWDTVKQYKYRMTKDFKKFMGE